MPTGTARTNGAKIWCELACGWCATNARDGWQEEDVGTHNPPATSMNLTNEDKLKRDASSLLKAGWNVERIAIHLAWSANDCGAGLITTRAARSCRR